MARTLVAAPAHERLRFRRTGGMSVPGGRGPSRRRASRVARDSRPTDLTHSPAHARNLAACKRVRPTKRGTHGRPAHRPQTKKDGPDISPGRPKKKIECVYRVMAATTGSF